MRSTSKSVLFAHIEHGKSVVPYVVGVFANQKSAGTYAGFLYAAYQSGDPATVKRVFPEAPSGVDGSLLPVARYTVKDAPYEPEITVTDNPLITES